jgi:phosphopantetheinyl transferase
MPFFKSIAINSNTIVYFWKITEETNYFLEHLSLNFASLKRLEDMKSTSHQNGFLAVRMLLNHLNYSDDDLIYDSTGKPKLSDGNFISISHSYGFSAITISNEDVGLDLEILKEKTLKIAPRFMDVAHLNDLNLQNKIVKATVIWGIKECIFKIKSEPGISFPNHIFENHFELKDKKTSAQLHFNSIIEDFSVTFDTIENYIYVVASYKK